MILLVIGTLLVCMAVLLMFSEWGSKSATRGNTVVVIFTVGFISCLLGTAMAVSQEGWLDAAKALLACYGAVIVASGLGMGLSVVRNSA